MKKAAGNAAHQQGDECVEGAGVPATPPSLTSLRCRGRRLRTAKKKGVFPKHPRVRRIAPSPKKHQKYDVGFSDWSSPSRQNKGCGQQPKKQTAAKKKAKTKSAEAAAKFTKKDWVCKCGFNNFSKNTACHKCKAAKPPRVGRNAAEDYLAAWAMMEKTEVDPVHHQYLLRQVGISSELREEFFEFFVQYCASMTKARRKKMLAGATKAHQRLGQILEALGGNANDGDSDSESESADDDETTVVGEATTAVEAAAAPTTAAPAKAQAKRKKRGNRGKKGRGQGAKSASAVIVPATPTAQETTA